MAKLCNDQWAIIMKNDSENSRNIQETQQKYTSIRGIAVGGGHDLPHVKK